VREVEAPRLRQISIQKSEMKTISVKRPRAKILFTLNI
jgi:hypothetical protein